MLRHELNVLEPAFDVPDDPDIADSVVITHRKKTKRVKSRICYSDRKRIKSSDRSPEHRRRVTSEHPRAVDIKILLARTPFDPDDDVLLKADVSNAFGRSDPDCYGFSAEPNIDHALEHLSTPPGEKSTPLPPGTVLSKGDRDPNVNDERRRYFQSEYGVWNWPSCYGRVDIQIALSQLGQVMASPNSRSPSTSHTSWKVLAANQALLFQVVHHAIRTSQSTDPVRRRFIREPRRAPIAIRIHSTTQRYIHRIWR